MFIQSCFIKKNTPEIINRLKELRIPHNDYDNGDRPWIAFNYGMWISVDKGHNKLFPDEIDCGENEELFLALAALRDDTDKNQYCINSEGNWFLYNRTYVRLLSKTNVSWHKATVEEIIEHFKDK